MSGHEFGLTILVFGALVVYLLPTLVAVARGHRVLFVAFMNVFMGWTIGGWVWSFVAAVW